jgi:hypothetical protein
MLIVAEPDALRLPVDEVYEGPSRTTWPLGVAALPVTATVT